MIKSLEHLKKRTKMFFSVATPLCNRINFFLQSGDRKKIKKNAE